MLKKVMSALVLLLMAPAVMAHGEGIHAHSAGLIAGFSHPVSGLDHLLAMVAVGLWAAQKGGRALWALPVTFVSLMALGSAMGVMGVALPGMEAGIALSVLVLGLLVAVQSAWSLQLACATVALFALLHGIAHGAEMPLAASPWGYGLGMLAATAMLHGAGVFAGVRVRQIVLRLTGAAISLAGFGMMFSLVG
jgi:urease accessory protein